MFCNDIKERDGSERRKDDADSFQTLDSLVWCGRVGGFSDTADQQQLDNGDYRTLHQR